jgi:hypothetical protein
MALPNFFQNGLDMLRMKNIFQPSPTYPTPMGGPTPPQPMELPNIPVQSGLPMQQPEFDVTSRMKELYQPQTAATDRYEQLLGQYPEYEKPGFWRSAAAALSAFGPGGHDTGMKVAQWNNSRRMEDWKNQVTPAYQAANLERQENINARQLAHNTVQNEVTMRRNEATARNQETQNKIRQQRADAYDYRVRNPNVKFDFNGPRVRILDPGTGRITETSWESKDFTPQEKLELEQKNALERIEKTGEQARKTEETRQEGRTDIAETRGWKPYTDAEGKVFMYNEITGETRDRAQSPQGTPTPRPSGAANRPELATQAKVRHYNAAIEFKNRNPELGRWVTPGAGNTFTIKPPKTGTFGSGPSPQQYEMIVNEIYGPDGPPQEEATPYQSSGPGGGRGGGSGRQGGPRFTPNSPPQAPQGWKYVPKKGGGWTAVPG